MTKKKGIITDFDKVCGTVTRYCSGYRNIDHRVVERALVDGVNNVELWNTESKQDYVSLILKGDGWYLKAYHAYDMDYEQSNAFIGLCSGALRLLAILNGEEDK